MGLMTGQHPSIPFPAPTTSMSTEALVAQGAGSPALCPLAAAYDSRLLGVPAVSPYAQHRFNVADLYGNGPGAYPDSAVAAAAAAAAAAGYVTGLPPSHPAAMLYPTSLTPYDLKDPRAAWAALPQTAGYPCDPTLVAYSAYGDRFDPVDSEARRRNATRETTSTLKAWLNEHRKNPYPTKGEKIMLAIITKMTLTQVSTWFANARRRLKKENKMTWEPRNKTNDDLDDVSIEDDDEDDKKDDTIDDDISVVERKSDDNDRMSDKGDLKTVNSEQVPSNSIDGDKSSSNQDLHSSDERISSPKDTNSSNRSKTPDKTEIFTSSVKTSDTKSNSISTKPKIWSLAQTAISDSPPPVRKNHLLPLPTQEDLDNRLRMSGLLFRDRVLPTELNSHFSRNNRDNAVDLPSREKLHQDSSAESSLSSPPLWKSNEHPAGSTEKFGRLTPYDSSDLRSLSSSSSSGSPAAISSSLEGPFTSMAPGLQYSHARLLGCRLLPYSQDNGTNTTPLPLVTSDRYHSHLSNPLSHNLDLRTIQSCFMRPSPYGCPINIATSQSNQTSSDLRR